MTKAEEGLGVVVENPIGVGFGQPQPFNIGESLFVGLVILQHRIVAAGYQLIRPERFESASECRF